MQGNVHSLALSRKVSRNMSPSPHPTLVWGPQTRLILVFRAGLRECLWCTGLSQCTLYGHVPQCTRYTLPPLSHSFFPLYLAGVLKLLLGAINTSPHTEWDVLEHICSEFVGEGGARYNAGLGSSGESTDVGKVRATCIDEFPKLTDKAAYKSGLYPALLSDGQMKET